MKRPCIAKQFAAATTATHSDHHNLRVYHNDHDFKRGACPATNMTRKGERGVVHPSLVSLQSKTRGPTPRDTQCLAHDDYDQVVQSSRFENQAPIIVQHLESNLASAHNTRNNQLITSHAERLFVQQISQSKSHSAQPLLARGRLSGVTSHSVT